MPENTSTVLIIDDSAVNLAIMTRLLRDHYRVKAVNNGAAALKAAHSSPPPDLILLDIMMPEMDGYAVCQKLKADPRTHDIPLIFLTAMSSNDAEERGLEIGAVDYISKPISPAIVLARVKTHLALKASSDSLRMTLEKVQTAHQQLQETLQQLVRAEKMAALGQLVAGVAHEINTPLGVAMTAVSLLDQKTQQLSAIASSGKIRRGDFDAFMTLVAEMSALLTSNLNRAARLVQSFKQVAADHRDGDRRFFTINTVLSDLIASLGAALRESGHTIYLDCPEELSLDGYPSALVQIMTNLMMNSVVHGFDPGQVGRLSVTVSAPDLETVVLIYADNGKGVADEYREKIFDPCLSG